MALISGDRTRIIICGDSGVGKTSLVYLISQGEPIKYPSWTIGCNVEVKIHDYKEGTPEEKAFFLELCDVGGSPSHRNSRHIFYQPAVHGVILVHDLTNKKSRVNLRAWLEEVLRCSGAGSWRPPVLIVGTKYDLAQRTMQNEGLPTHRRSPDAIASHHAAEELFVDCHQSPSAFSPGSTNAVQLSKWLDKCVEFMFLQRGLHGHGSGADRAQGLGGGAVEKPHAGGGPVDRRKSKHAVGTRGASGYPVLKSP